MKLLLVLLAGGLLVGVAVAGGRALIDPPPPNYALRAAEADGAVAAALRQNQAAAAQAARDAEDAALLAALGRAVQIVGVAAILVVVVVGTAAACYRLWQVRRPLARVQVPGLVLTVPRAALEAGHYRDLPYAALNAQVEIARYQPPVPASVNYGNTHWQNNQTGGAGVEAGPLTAPPFVPPSIGEAAERGAFRDGRYIFGYAPTNGTPVPLDQESGRSVLLGGQGGSGGTTALLVAGLQEILMPFYLPGQQEGARFLIVDYHARKPQGLLQRIGDDLGDRVIATAHTPDEVQRVTRYFEAECKARVNGGPTPFPLVFIADEVGNLLDDADYAEVAPGLLTAFAHANNAYRAVGGKAIVRAHTLQASAWGNSATVRQSFHVRIGMRLDEGAGILLGLKPAIARTLLALPAGQAYVTGPGLPPTHVVSSNVRRGDIGTVLDLAGYRAKARTVYAIGAAEGNPPPAPRTPERAPEGNLEGNADGLRDGTPEGNPMAGRIYDLFMGGTALPDVVETVYGVSSTNGGRKYQSAKDDAESRLRAEVSRRLQQPPGQA